MLILQSALIDPDGLAFSPDGLSLLAVENSRVQVWPRWLDQPPRRARKVQATLERYAFSPSADRVYLYVSGNSHTRVLTFKPGVERATALPSGGPTWFHFTTDGGYFLTSHDRGTLTRFDIAPGSEADIRKAWSIKRQRRGSSIDDPIQLGSHYRFGAICDPAGAFVALEYRYGRGEPIDGLVVRSVTDGKLIRRQNVTVTEGRELLADAGLRLAIHPTGTYFAYPQGDRVRLWPLVRGVKLPKTMPLTPAACRAVAFHPSGALLAAVASHEVLLYDTATWQVARTFAWGIGELRAVCFSPDGTRAAVIGAGAAPRRGKKATGGKIVVWDVDA